MNREGVHRRGFVATSAGLASLAAGVGTGVTAEGGTESDDGNGSDDGGQGAETTADDASVTTEGLTAGAATRDVTPENGQSFFGYARPDIFAEGVSIRLFAQAVVLSDGDRKVALVGGDLGRPEVREKVLEHARPLGFDRNTLLFTTTHTHAGPDEMSDWIAAQIGDAIAEADANRQPARAAWAEAEVPEGNQNRSIEAHLANYGLDIEPGEGSVDDHPVDPDLARDTTLRLLRVEATDGTPIAAWTCYANHPTTFTPDNTTFSADFPGVTARWFAHRFDDEAPVAVHAAGALGDVITPYDDYGMYALAERTAVRVEAAMWEAWRDAGEALSRELPVGGRSRRVTFDGQSVGDGKRVASHGLFGIPLLNGGENGPTPFTGLELEGRRRPGWLADDVHGRKIPLIPAIWSDEVEIQVLRVGDRLLATVPGEPTTEVGRRAEEAVLAAAPDEVTDVSVVGIANGYHGYFTTPDEYDQQHYEGGHTAFGKYSSLLVEQTQSELAAAFADGPGEAPDPAGSRPSNTAAPVGDGASDGELTDQPRETVERMETVEIAWEGGDAGEDRPVGEPFLRLERAVDGTGDGDDDGDGEGSDRSWEPVADDLGLGFVWTEWYGDYEARYDVPPDLPTGTYRLRVTAARYELTTHSFEIVPSSGLRVRGIEADQRGREGATRLTTRAQNPAPDPDENLRSRERSPHGGVATVVVDGKARDATWDDEADGWVVTVPDVEDGDTVTVPEAGVVDAFGNHSGAAVEVTVGEVADVEWPEHMETGGGDPPGLFGIGTIPT